MPTDVHSVAFIIHGSGETSHEVALLQNDWFDASPGKQLAGRRQPSRPSPDDDRKNRDSLNCAIFLRLLILLPHFLSICHVAAAV